MKKEFTSAVFNGRVIKSNTFDTTHGSYAIDILVDNGTFYFFKTKNGKVVECLNLTDMAKGLV
jgi:hypothetical protein